MCTWWGCCDADVFCVCLRYLCLHSHLRRSHRHADPIILLIKPTNTSKRPNTPQMWVPGTVPGLVSDKAHLLDKQQRSHSTPSLQSPSPALSISSPRFIFSKWFDSFTLFISPLGVFCRAGCPPHHQFSSSILFNGHLFPHPFIPLPPAQLSFYPSSASFCIPRFFLSVCFLNLFSAFGLHRLSDEF